MMGRLSESEWYPDWPLYTLGQICNIRIGKTPPTKVTEYWGGQHTWVTISDMNSRFVTQSKRTITDKALQERKVPLVKKGTLLMSFKLTIGKLAFAGKDLFTNEAIAAFEVKEEFKKRVLPDYLYWALQIVPLETEAALAVKGKTINQKTIKMIRLPLPIVPEQQRIVARLEALLGEVRALREDVQSMRRDLAQVMESAMAEVFPDPQGEVKEGWEWKRLGDLFDLRQGASMSPSRRQGTNPHPFLRAKNILWGEVDTSDVDSMDFTEDEIERLKLEKGDLLICEGGDVGRTAVWEAQLPLAMYQNHIHRLRRKSDDIESKFYIYWMKTAYQVFRIYQGEESRTAIPNLSGGRLKNFLVPQTSLAEQRRIVASLERIAEETRAMDALLEHDLRDLDALEQSILAAAFRGEM
jgi:type I restriction enzyme S subunit